MKIKFPISKYYMPDMQKLSRYGLFKNKLSYSIIVHANFIISLIIGLGNGPFTPMAISIRIVSAFWWFFILMMFRFAFRESLFTSFYIFCSAYTANLVFFLSIETKDSRIESVEDLAR